MLPCVEEIIEVPGFQLGMKRWGPKTGTPILAFHGMLDNAASFDFLGPLMKSPLIAIDSPGCGKSSHYPEGILPQWLEETFLMYHLVDALGLETFNILGHSRGTIIGLAMAVTTPERVKKLGLIEALGPPGAYSERIGEYLRKALDNYLTYKKKPVSVYKDFDLAVRERMKGGSISYESARALTSRGTEETPEGFVWTFDRRIRSMQPSFPHDDQVNAILGLVEAPTCLIMGTEGLKYSEEVFNKRKNLIKSLETHQVEGAHHLHMDNPKPVAEILDQFFSL